MPKAVLNISISKCNPIFIATLLISIFDFREFYPMILVANKVDLVHLRKITEEQGRELAAQLKVILFIPLIYY